MNNERFLYFRKAFLAGGIILLGAIYGIQLLLSGRDKIHVLSISQEPDCIEIALSADETVAVEKRDGKWFVKNYPANENSCSQIVSAISEIKVLGTASTSLTESDRFGLDGAIEVTAKASGKVIRKIAVGKNSATGSQCYASIDGSSSVSIVRGPLRSVFSVTADGLRDKTVLEFEADKILSVRVEADGGFFVVEKSSEGSSGEKWALSETSLKNRPVLSDHKISEWISSCSSLKCSSWLGDDYVPHSPKTGSVHFVSSSVSQSVEFFDDGRETVTVRSSQNPWLAEVPREVMKEFLRQLSDISEKAD